MGVVPVVILSRWPPSRRRSSLPRSTFHTHTHTMMHTLHTSWHAKGIDGASGRNRRRGRAGQIQGGSGLLHGYLAHKKIFPRRTLQ